MFGQKPLWSVDFQYDRYSKTCINRTHYFGLGIVYAKNRNYEELGAKVMWNPTRVVLVASRTAKFYPYLFGQANYIRLIPQVNGAFNGYGVRPGIGITGNLRDDQLVNIRTHLQVGCTIPLDNLPTNKVSLAIELKVGLGINAKRLKRNAEGAEEVIETN